jgi:eukaryotic-like serine/threonine-protein kinase
MATLDTKTVDLSPATMEGVIIGTVAYMSPEQAEGLPIDHRSDIFSFGTVLYEMASGRRPFGGQTTISTLSAILSREAPPLSDTTERVQLELDRIVRRCLRKERERRIQHMDDVKLALEELAETLKSSAEEGTRGPAALTSSAVSVPSALKTADAIARPRSSWRALAPWGILGVVAAASIYWVLTRDVTPLLPPILTRLTADAGLSAYPALSADGALLAFASDRSGDGTLDIWVQQTGQSQPLRLTNDPSDDYDPAFSPDGTRIAFRSDRDGGGIYVVPAFGGAARLIARGGRRPRFSPDGKRIAFWVGGMGAAFIPGSTSVYVVSADGGETQRVHPEFAAVRHPVWMPDGRLLFIGRRDADVDWWIAPTDAGPAVKTGALPMLRGRQLRPPSGDYTINPTHVLPDGRGVLFSGTLGDSTNVWQLDLSARGEASERPRQVTFGTSLEAQPAAGGRGPLAVAFSSLTVNVDIWSAPIDETQGRITGADERLTEAVSFEGYPDISRDGRRLAFVASRPGGWDVRLRDVKAGTETTLASGASPLLQTRISVDGSHVVYWQRDDESRAVYLVSSSGGVTQKLCEECGPSTDVYADGSFVLLDSVGPPEGIRLLNTKSKKDLLLISSKLHPDAFLYNARFSPDSRWIAFHATMGSPTARQIFIVPFRGEHVAFAPGGITDADWVPVTDGSQLDRDPYWSPDGSALYFLSERDGFRCVWMHHLEPSTKRPIGAAVPVRHFHTARRSLSTADVRTSAVGVSLTPGRMFFGVAELTGNIWLATEQTNQPRD